MHNWRIKRASINKRRMLGVTPRSVANMRPKSCLNSSDDGGRDKRPDSNANVSLDYIGAEVRHDTQLLGG